MLVAILLLPCRVMATDNDLELTVKSAYIYNFIQFIDWPEQQNGAAPESVKICIIGGGQFGTVLAALSSRQAKGRPLEVKHEQPDSQTLPTCHVVVIDRSAEEQLPHLFAQLAGTNVLTVSDIPQFTRKGGGIGFVIIEGKVRFEINSRITQQAGLKVHAKLLELAKIVQ